jgi:MYXO-CTERM domain-containing protein
MKLMLVRRHSRGRLLRLSLAVAVFCTVGSAALAATAAPIKVACIGEHTTHSHAFPALNRETQPVGMQEYPALLQTRLGAGYDVRNFGDCCASVIQGYSTVGQENHPYVQGSNAGDGAGYNESIAFLPDIVVIGSWGRHDWGLSTASTLVWNLPKFQQDYDNLVQRYMALSTHPRVFASLPVPILNGTDTDNGVLTSSIATVIRAVAAKYNLPIVDLYAAFLNHRELYKQPPDAEGEGEHVTNAGLGIIADKVYAAMLADITVADGGPSQADATSGARDAASVGDASSDAGATGTGTGSGGATGAGGSSSTGAGGLAGSASTGSSATGSGVGGATVTTGGQGGGAANTPALSSGCSCRSSPRSTPWSAALGALGCLAILRRRSRQSVFAIKGR